MSFDSTVVQRMRGACNVVIPIQVIADLINVNPGSHNNLNQTFLGFVPIRNRHTAKHVLSAKVRPFID